MRIVETFKSRTAEERSRNVTEAIIALENSHYHRNETYTQSEKLNDEIV
jgi:hypothetical protein